ETMSDSALIPAPAKGASPAAKAAVVQERATTKTWPALVRLALATALAVGILFWPYPSRCGLGLAGYGVAVVAVTLGGLWSSVWTWRHRTARAHVLSLLLIAWGLMLGTMEVLPRIGYAKADAARPVGFSCVAPTTPVTPATTTAPKT
ncbi:MAG: hypothetical protein ABIY52_02055, partial [Gemmatimonadaceae bacterium]